ncbi:MAG: hypothetical protein ACK5RO_00110 [Pseudobdellovibrionaceae bacterium]
MALEISSGRHQRTEGNQTGSQAKRGSHRCGVKGRGRAPVTGVTGDLDRDPLYGRHLTKEQREAPRAFIDVNKSKKPVAAICKALELHPRSYYRWVSGNLKSHHGGGGGQNKITPLEEKRVVALAKKHPEWHCRRIAYHLEQKSKVFIGKTKVAEIMKAHELNHPFERNPAKFVKELEDMLVHEPCRRNYNWGMASDWTWSGLSSSSHPRYCHLPKRSPPLAQASNH